MFSRTHRIHRTRRAALAAAVAIAAPFALAPTAHATPSPAHEVDHIDAPALGPQVRHGYISSPPSRQAMCAARRVKDCGDAEDSPQNVKGAKGLRKCSGNNPRFLALDDETKAWPATKVKNTVTFNWVLTAPYRTSTWDYYIGDTRIARFDSQGEAPTSPVIHTVDLNGRTGRLKVLAVWNIADTENAYYSCVDLQR
jgi:predicted carbohydrate-binding protein with CBM5 and CBM33 domain